MPFGFNPYRKDTQTDREIAGCGMLLLLVATAGLSALAVKSYDAKTRQTPVAVESASYEPVSTYVDLDSPSVDMCNGKSAPAGSLDRQINDELVRNSTCA